MILVILIFVPYSAYSILFIQFCYRSSLRIITVYYFKHIYTKAERDLSIATRSYFSGVIQVHLIYSIFSIPIGTPHILVISFSTHHYSSPHPQRLSRSIFSHCQSPFLLSCHLRTKVLSGPKCRVEGYLHPNFTYEEVCSCT